MRTFLASCIEPLSRRSLLFMAVNALYFGSIFVATLFMQGQYLPLYELPVGARIFPEELDSPLVVVVNIFLFNLIVSGFLLVTLSGLLFFAVPVGVLVLRAVSWGVLLNQLPTPLFLAAFITVVLEGEGYVLASIPGINLGLSWLKPNWVFRSENLSRRQALTAAFKECARLYVLVVVFLLAGAIMETATIVFVLTSV